MYELILEAMKIQIEKKKRKYKQHIKHTLKRQIQRTLTYINNKNNNNNNNKNKKRLLVFFQP